MNTGMAKTVHPSKDGVILRLCRSFEANSPKASGSTGRPALTHINDHKKLPKETRERLYEFRARLDTNQPMQDLVKKFGIMATLRVGFMLWPIEFRTYLAGQAAQFTERRKPLKNEGFFAQVFGKRTAEFRAGGDSLEDYNLFRKYLWDIIGNEEKIQQSSLPLSNRSAMRQDSDVWPLFWTQEEGTSIQSTTVCFDEINNPYFKAAFKHYLSEHRWRGKINFRSDQIVGMTARALNFLSAQKHVTTPSDVTVKHVIRLTNYLSTDARSYKGEPLKFASIRGHFKVLNQMWDYLMREGVVVPGGQPAVMSNPFRSISFKNENDHTDSTKYIPEEVIEQLRLHQLELDGDVNRCLTTMFGSALRFQDAVLLEEGCLTYDEELDLHILKYVQKKSLLPRRERGLPDYHEIGIKDLDVVRAITEQESLTKDLRAASNSKLIFLRTPSEISSKVNILSASGFTNPIRQLITKYSITDHDGNLWDFSSHQCRKSVAVRMVRNKANPVEIMQFLGHMDQKSTAGIYAEVRKEDLAELNHEFFEKKFMTKVPPEQLEKFSVEERKVLYLEFAQGQRDVELGKCVKHVSEGPCGKRTGKTNCAICNQLCTGPRFEPKWRTLVESQQRDVTEFEKVYQKLNIPESKYIEYVEYKNAVKLLRKYSAALIEVLAYAKGD